jgi:hypothetical protein
MTVAFGIGVLILVCPRRAWQRNRRTIHRYKGVITLGELMGCGESTLSHLFTI